MLITSSRTSVALINQNCINLLQHYHYHCQTVPKPDSKHALHYVMNVLSNEWADGQ